MIFLLQDIKIIKNNVVPLSLKFNEYELFFTVLCNNLFIIDAKLQQFVAYYREK
jgi:hypothetical protein